MDLIPTPDQVVAAAENVARALVRGGMADLRPMPRAMIAEGALSEVHHYEPAADVAGRGGPVLLVAPLAAPPLCYDLRRGCSLVEHLVGVGRPTYLVEYGEVSFRDRDLGIEPWIDEVVPAAVRAVVEHAGGRPVHLVGWSVGGILALLGAADDASLPIASITALGTPFDVRQVPIVAPGRPLLDITQGLAPITRLYQAAGGPPQPLVRWALEFWAFQRLVTRPLAIARHLDDADYLAQIQAVDRLIGQMTAYPSRAYGQLYHRLLKADGLVDGTFEVGDRTVDVAAISAPVMVVAGSTDGIAPVDSVHAGEHLFTGSREVRFEVVPGGHLGMLTGRAARTSTWPALDEWLDRWATQPASAAAPARRTTRKAAAKGTAKKATAKKATTRKTTATKKTRTRKTTKIAPPTERAVRAEAIEAPGTGAPETEAPGTEAPGTEAAETAMEPQIGVNPERRYGSASSRDLRR